MSADRGAYVCQSQSLNLFIKDPSFKNLTSMHFYAWESGLKTGLYYLRIRDKAKPQQFTIEPEKQTASSSTTEDKDIIEEKDCLMCGS